MKFTFKMNKRSRVYVHILAAATLIALLMVRYEIYLPASLVFTYLLICLAGLVVIIGLAALCLFLFKLVHKHRTRDLEDEEDLSC